MSRFPVQIAGLDLEIESRGWGRPRLLREGREVYRDRWEHYVVTDAQGREHRPELSYNQLHMSPVIHDAHERTATIVAPLSRRVVGALLVTLVLGVVLGGALGLILVSIAERLSVDLWRRADRDARKVAPVLLFWIVLVAFGVLQMVELLS